MLVERTDQEYCRLLRNIKQREEEYGKEYWVVVLRPEQATRRESLKA
jgi:hypothetical protein